MPSLVASTINSELMVESKRSKRNQTIKRAKNEATETNTKLKRYTSINNS